MFTKIEEPNPEKYSWEKNNIMIDNSEEFSLKIDNDFWENFFEIGKRELPPVVDKASMEAAKVCNNFGRFFIASFLSTFQQVFFRSIIFFVAT